MLIFGHTDHENDRLEVVPRESGGCLVFRIPEDRDNGLHARGVYIPRDDALDLYSALGEWLYPVHTPEGPNRSLIEELIAKAVKEQVTAVLPLHLKTVGRVCTRDESCKVADPEPLRCDYDCSGCNPDDDPEPHDVGHVDRPHPCDEPLKPGQLLQDVHEACGFLWALHKVMAPVDKPEPEHGRLMAELPRRPRTAPKCLDCLHGWGEHTGGICWGTGGQDNEGDGCRCTRERPSALSGALPSALAPKTECTCVHPRVALHNCLGCVERSCTCRWTGAS